MKDDGGDINVATFKSADDSGRFTRGACSFLGFKETPCLVVKPYGLLHKPPDDSMAVTLYQGGRESSILAIVDDPNNRPLKNLQSGEVALANYKTTDHVYFKANGSIEIKSGGAVITVTDGQVTINGADLTLNGSLQVNGDVTATGTVTGETDIVAGVGGSSNHLLTHMHIGSPTAPTGGISPTGLPSPGT